MNGETIHPGTAMGGTGFFWLIVGEEERWLGGLVHGLADRPLEAVRRLAQLEGAEASLQQRGRALSQPQDETLEVRSFGRRQPDEAQGRARGLGLDEHPIGQEQMPVHVAVQGTTKSLDQAQRTSQLTMLNDQLGREVAERREAEQALARALEESLQRQAEVSGLLAGWRAVVEQHAFQDAARTIFDSGKALIRASAGYVALMGPDGTENEILFLDAGALPCTVDPSLPMPIRGLRAEAYRSGTTVYQNDFQHSRWVQLLPEGHAPLQNALFAPLLVQGKAAGLLGFANKAGSFTENDARLATA
jgi:hypothetical protein